MFTSNEKETRFKAIRDAMISDNLKALILVGDQNVGQDFFGDLRYFTDMRIIAFRQIILIFPDTEPVLLVGSALQKKAAVRGSFVSDCRSSENYPQDIANIMKERGVVKGKVGTCFETLPLPIYLYLKDAFPEIQWVEFHDRILNLRFGRSEEEADVFRKGALLCDKSFAAVLEIMKPGVTEYEIAAEIEYVARSKGAEEHFTLIGTGRFPSADPDQLPSLYAPTSRKVKNGDVVGMEITPRFGGYWTQIVRTVQIGEPDQALLDIHKICTLAIKHGLGHMNPGKRVCDVVTGIEQYVSKAGYVLRAPLGHICGVDLVEARISVENETELTPGMALIIHPAIFTPDGKNGPFFWGETYLVTSDGHERLQKTGNELAIIS